MMHEWYDKDGAAGCGCVVVIVVLVEIAALLAAIAYFWPRAVS